MSASIEDVDETWLVVSSEVAFEGKLIGVRHDVLRGADGQTFERDVVTHPGAVAVVAVNEQEQLLVIRQYRHPVRRQLVELPAGLLDKEGEDRLAAAKRELAEEGHLRSDRWSTLLTVMPSPGMSNEVVTIYLAEGAVEDNAPDGFVAEHEESTMTREWVDVDALVDAILRQQVSNSLLVAGVLAYAARRR